MGEKKSDSEILTLVVKELGETKYSFAKQLDYKSVQSVYHVIDKPEIYKLNEGMITKIIKAFPKVNYNFLKKGEGKILLDGDELRNQLNFFNIPLNEDVTIEDIVKGVSLKLSELIDLQTENNELLKAILNK